MRSVSKEYRVVILWMLSLLLFSEVTFYTEDRLGIYFIILVFETIATSLVILLKWNYVKRIIDSKFIFWVSLFFIFISIDAYFRINYGVFNYMRTFASWGVLMIVWIFLRSLNDRHVVVNTFCKACEIAAMSTCVYEIVSENARLLTGSLRIGDSLAGNVNTVGMNLGIFSLAILYLYISTRKKRHILIYVIVVIFMLLTGSKKVFFTLILAVVMYFLYGEDKLRKSVIISVSAIIVIYEVLNNVYLYNIIGFRIVDFLGNIGFGLKGSQYIYSFSTEVRESLIVTASSLFDRKPLLGWGFNSVAANSTYHFYAHNNLLELLANNGLIGFTFFYSWHFFCLAKIKQYRIEKSIKIFLVILVINAILNDFAIVTYTTNGAMPYVIFALIDVNLILLKRETYQKTKVLIQTDCKVNA